MASQFQNRLLGTVILVAIGVIVLPDILDGEKTHYQEESKVMAIASDVDIANDGQNLDMPLTAQTINSSQQQQPSDDDEWVAQVDAENSGSEIQDSVIIQEPTDDALTAQSNTAQTSTNTQSNSQVAQTAEPEFQGSGWIIQLMSLKNKDNAAKLVDDLKSRGYLASYEEATGGWIRVLIGPDVSKQKLERQIGELEKITGSKGVLRTYTP